MSEPIILSDVAVIVLAIVAWFIVVNVLAALCAFLMVTWGSPGSYGSPELGQALLPIVQKLVDAMSAFLERDGGPV
jgi:hypothetical protein